MPRKSSRFLWKEGDGDGKKDDSNPKLYDEPPHKLVEGDESTYPPKFVDLSSMWVFQVVRCPFITQDDRYQRWPAVFLSKKPLRPSWVNKGLAPKVWSYERNEWVYPVVFNKYQLHGDEGIEEYDMDQSQYLQTEGTNATHDILEGATCIIQEPPVSSGGLSSGGLQAAPTADGDSSPSNKGESDEPPTKRQRLRSAKKAEPSGNETEEPPMPAPKRLPTGKRSRKSAIPLSEKSSTPKAPSASKAVTSAVRLEPTPLKSSPAVLKTSEKSSPAIKAEQESSPSTRVIDSATGGKRFLIEDSPSDEEQGDVGELRARIAALEEDKARFEDQLLQAQGKVVHLAAALHGMWGILGEYADRMTDWSGFVRRRTKGANKETLDSLLDNLADNKKVNDSLLRRVNSIVEETSAIFPALDRITQDDKKFDAWRNKTPKHLEKLIERDDHKVDGTGRV